MKQKYCRDGWRRKKKRNSRRQRELARERGIERRMKYATRKSEVKSKRQVVGQKSIRREREANAHNYLPPEGAPHTIFAKHKVVGILFIII